MSASCRNRLVPRVVVVVGECVPSSLTQDLITPNVCKQLGDFKTSIRKQGERIATTHAGVHKEISVQLLGLLKKIGKVEQDASVARRSTIGLRALASSYTPGTDEAEAAAYMANFPPLHS